METKFETAPNSRWVEIRTYSQGDTPPPWIRTSADIDSIKGASDLFEWEEVDDFDQVISQNVRRKRLVSGTFSGLVLEAQELTRYGGLYEQVEALRQWLNQRNEIVTSQDEADSLIEETRQALEDVLAHDRFERDALAPEGHCRHGRYLGGCGIDWMCGPCEDGAE